VVAKSLHAVARRASAASTGRTVLVFGANGFIGHHLVRRILRSTRWRVIANDIRDARLAEFQGAARFEFIRGSIGNRAFVERLVRRADVVLPLAGIATPQTYIHEPIRVFELDFEDNLEIVRLCVAHEKRVIWPSTSEVYGMNTDKQFHPERSHLVLGPINMCRWIYAASKQLIDRIIWSYGRDNGLDYTIFRPFNWIGYGQDDIHAKTTNARVLTRFLGNILRGENLTLVDGGSNRRSFTYIDDGIDALVRIIDNKNGIASGKIYNIGNPNNNRSILELAKLALELAPRYRYFRDRAASVRIVNVTSSRHYGEGYQDMVNRTPFVGNTRRELGWRPRVTLRRALERTYEAYVEELAGERRV
jgi:nucleoside-diphosphate-sugar epimerase